MQIKKQLAFQPDENIFAASNRLSEDSIEQVTNRHVNNGEVRARTAGWGTLLLHNRNHFIISRTFYNKQIKISCSVCCSLTQTIGELLRENLIFTYHPEIAFTPPIFLNSIISMFLCSPIFGSAGSC